VRAVSVHRSLDQIDCRAAIISWPVALRAALGLLLLLAWVAPASGAPVRIDNATELTDTAVPHLVFSELVTGGSSASDEFVEIYNPSPTALPLEGLELVYVTASGATVTRKASWAAGAPEIPAQRHLLIANSAGIYATIADAVYATGLAATGGSVALRIQGATTAIDAVGWGTASSTWLEGSPAPVAPAGASIERLPGSAAGSSQDTDDNLADFAIRALPDPQNSTAAPTPGETASPTLSGTPSPIASPTQTPEPISSPTPTPSTTATPEPTPSPTPTPTPTPIATVTPAATATVTPTPAPTPTSIAAARAFADGSSVTIAGVALTGSAFSEGGGYLDDGTAGIAVLMSDGAFERGALLTVSGTVEDRYAQRTVRVSASELTAGGGGAEPVPARVGTGAVGEPTEGRLVSVTGEIQGAPTALSGGLAFDLDDGSGAVRLFVSTSTGIGTDDWSRGARLTLVGVVGQRDSSGTGSAGYRVQPRDSADIGAVVPQPTPSPSPTATPAATSSPSPHPSPTMQPSSSASPSAGSVVTIATARAADAGTRLQIRGVVTMSSGLLDAGSAVMQDSSAGILIRLGDEAGGLRQGEQVELGGTRSTKSGMLTIRVTDPPTRRSVGTEPATLSLRTGSAGEEQEARLVKVRGAVATAPRRSSAGSVSFDLDDGSGALRVFVLAAVASEVTVPARGSWVEITGVLGQETTGALPRRGYRLWPRTASDVRIVSLPVEAAAGAGASSAASDDLGSGSAGDDDLAPLLPGASGEAGRAKAVRATLVHAAWPELGLAGLLWDGSHLVGLVDGIVAETAVNDVVAAGGPPVAVQLEAQPAAEGRAPLRLPLISLRTEDRLERSAAPPTPPISSATKATSPVWARLVGTLTTTDGAAFLKVSGGARIRIEPRCAAAAPLQRRGLVMVEGILAPADQRLVVGCHAVTSAPTLRAAAAAALAAPTAAPGTSRASPGPRNGGQPAGPAIALLLGAVAALALLGLVAWRRGLVQRLLPRTAGDELDDAFQPGEATAAPGLDETRVDLRVPPLRLVEASKEVELPLRS
jgi:cell division septation protein DedD